MHLQASSKWFAAGNGGPVYSAGGCALPFPVCHVSPHLVNVCCWHVSLEADGAPSVSGVAVLLEGQVSCHKAEQVARLGEWVLQHAQRAQQSESPQAAVEQGDSRVVSRLACHHCMQHQHAPAQPSLEKKRGEAAMLLWCRPDQEVPANQDLTSQTVKCLPSCSCPASRRFPLLSSTGHVACGASRHTCHSDRMSGRSGKKVIMLN